MITAIAGAGTDGEPFKRAMVLMREVLVIRAQPCPASDEIEYMGLSPLFDELAEGELIPEYDLEGQTVEHEEDCPKCGHLLGGNDGCETCGGTGTVIRREYLVKAFKRMK
jgi:hypothetical protein